MRPSQNLPLPPRIYSPFEHLRSICDPLGFHPSLPEYNRLSYKATLLESTLPLFSQLCEHSYDLPLPVRIYPSPFLNIYATLPESTPPSLNIPTPPPPPPLNIYMRHSQNLHVPPPP